MCRVVIGDRLGIKAHGRVVTGTAVSVEYYHDEWVIEMTDADVPGGYSSWHQGIDGGYLVSVNGKQPLIATELDIMRHNMDFLRANGELHLLNNKQPTRVPNDNMIRVTGNPFGLHGLMGYIICVNRVDADLILIHIPTRKGYGYTVQATWEDVKKVEEI